MRSICAVTTTPRPGHAGSIDLCHMSHEARRSTWCGRAGEEGGPCAAAPSPSTYQYVLWWSGSGAHCPAQQVALRSLRAHARASPVFLSARQRACARRGGLCVQQFGSAVVGQAAAWGRSRQGRTGRAARGVRWMATAAALERGGNATRQPYYGGPTYATRSSLYTRRMPHGVRALRRRHLVP